MQIEVGKTTSTDKVHNKETQRPFRLWDAEAKKNLPWRCFKNVRRAHMAAIEEVRWAKPGRTIEVYDSRNMRLVCQYTKTPTSVRISA